MIQERKIKKWRGRKEENQKRAYLEAKKQDIRGKKERQFQVHLRGQDLIHETTLGRQKYKNEFS